MAIQSRLRQKLMINQLSVRIVACSSNKAGDEGLDMSVRQLSRVSIVGI